MASSADDVFASLREGFDEASAAGAFDDDLDEFMQDVVVPVWVANSPEDTRAYKDSVGIVEPAKGGRGSVGATDEAANVIEYGSVDTPEFAPRAKTIAEFERQ